MNLRSLSNFFKKDWDKVILVVLILIYFVTFTSLSILRHDAFASRFDLSNMDQTVYNTLNGHFFSFRHHEDLVSRFSIHADLILVLLAPLYLIKEDVRMLLGTQSLFLALGAIPVFFLSLRVLKDKLISIVITTSYLLNPAMQWTNIYDFHGVALSIPFFLAAFYFAYIKKWKWYALFVILALLTKEQISLNIVMLGLAVIFIFRNRLAGFLTILIGIAWFISMVYVVMPYFSPYNSHWALTEFEEGSFFEIIKSFTEPSVFLNTFLFDNQTIDYYLLLLRPFAFLPLLGLPWLLLSSPDLAINVIRDTRNINFHYDSGVTPALVIATIFGFYYLKYLLQHIAWVKKLTIPLLYVLTFVFLLYSLRVNYQYSPLPTTPSCWCDIYNVTNEDREFEKALQNIPKDAFITASLEIRPHINHRELAFSVPSATESARYIALINQNRIAGNYNPKEYENELIAELLSNPEYKAIFEGKHLFLFENLDYKAEFEEEWR